jgi:hypothetical protein
VYRHFGEVDAAGTSPLYECVAVALSESDEALRAIEAAPARKRHPTVILAALHDLALAGRGPTRPDAAPLYPAIAEAARRVGANAVGLIDVGCSAGLNLNVERVGITYSNGQSLGDPSSPVHLSPSIVGDRPIPTRAMPEVVARIGVDLDPVDVTDANDARWLRACLWPDQPERVARLEAEMALAATAPPLLLQGDAVEVVPDAFARVPADALPVVTTTWALSHFPLERRLRFLHRLDEAAAGQAVAWVSAEGSESRRRYRHLAIAAPLATASSAWRCSTGRLCAPRPSAAAGRRAACSRGWQTPSVLPAGVLRSRASGDRRVRGIGSGSRRAPIPWWGRSADPGAARTSSAGVAPWPGPRTNRFHRRPGPGR